MVRLRDIPPEKLREIERFVRQQRGKVPVTGGGRTPDGRYVKNLVELVEEKFGVKLSPQQIFRLQRGERKIRVPIEKEVAEMLKEEYGSVSEGLKHLSKLARMVLAKPPPEYVNAISQLGGRKLDYEAAVFELRQLGYKDPDRVIRELARLGFLTNEGGKLVFHRRRVPPEYALIMYLAGLGR